MPVFSATDGVEISYQCWEQDSGLPPVLLHHGFIADGRTNWVEPGVVSALVAAGRRVVTIDARGHGESGKPHAAAYYGEIRMGQDVSELIDVLGESAFDLVGYSMGAIVALLTATRDRRVRRLVAGGIGAGVVDLGGVDTRVIGGGALQHALRADDPSSIDDDSAAGFRAFVDAVGGDHVALALQAASLHDQPIPFDAIEVPALVLAGRDDALAARPEKLVSALPDAVLRTVEGDHLGAVRDPDFTSELIGFLNEV